MIRKKIFGIGAVILMILVAMTPVISGMQLNDERRNENNCILISGGYDLKVTITNGPYLASDEPIESDGKTYSLYYIEYVISNVGNAKYKGVPSTYVMPENGPEGKVIDYWYEYKNEEAKTPITLEKGASISRNRKIKVELSNDEDIDEEKYFINKNIRLESGISGGNEINPEDNVDAKKSWKFWRDSGKWMPTRRQLIGFGENSKGTKLNTVLNGNRVSFNIPSFMFDSNYFPGGFNKLKNRLFSDLNNDKFKQHFNQSQLGLGEGQFHLKTDGYNIINGNENTKIIEEIWDLLEKSVEYIFNTLPETWNNHRLGWVNQMTLYRSRILIDLVAFGMFCMAFYIDGKEYFDSIADWFSDLVEIIVQTITTGVFPMLKFDAFLAKIPKILSDILNLIKIFFTEGYSIILYAIFEKTNLDIEKIRMLKGEKPWEAGIRVYGKVGQMKNDEVAKVSCRGEYEKVKTNNGEYSFEVPSEHIDGDLGKDYKGLHLCKVTCDGDKHENNIVTKSIASYCFSGGEVYRYFLLDDDDGSRSRTKNTTYSNFFQDIIQKFPAIRQLVKLLDIKNTYGGVYATN